METPAQLQAARAIFVALFDGMAVGTVDEGRWEHFVKVADEAGRLVFGWSPLYDDTTSIFGALDDIARDFEAGRKALADTVRGLREALGEDEAPEIKPQRLDPALVREWAAAVSDSEKHSDAPAVSADEQAVAEVVAEPVHIVSAEPPRAEAESARVEAIADLFAPAVDLPDLVLEPDPLKQIVQVEPSAGQAQTAAARETIVAARRAALSPKQAQVIEALRRLGSRTAVAEELGLRIYQNVDTQLAAAAAKGLLPTDLPDLPRRLRLQLGLDERPRPRPTQVTNRMTLAQDAEAERTRQAAAEIKAREPA